MLDSLQTSKSARNVKVMLSADVRYKMQYSTKSSLKSEGTAALGS